MSDPVNKGIIPRTFRAALAVANECTGKVDDIDYKFDKWNLTHQYRIMLDSQMAYLTKMNLNRLLQKTFKEMLTTGEFTYWI